MNVRTVLGSRSRRILLLATLLLGTLVAVIGGLQLSGVILGLGIAILGLCQIAALKYALELEAEIGVTRSEVRAAATRAQRTDSRAQQAEADSTQLGRHVDDLWSELAEIDRELVVSRESIAALEGRLEVALKPTRHHVRRPGVDRPELAIREALDGLPTHIGR